MDRTQKTALEMNFNEFVSWATAFIIFGIGEGTKLKDLVCTIIDHAVRNKVFGGDRPQERFFVLKENSKHDNNRCIDVTVKHEKGYLKICPQGYGENSIKGDGSPVKLELYQNKLRLIVSPHIESPLENVIDLEQTRKS